MKNSAMFRCICGKSDGWVIEGETMKNACPECNRRYYGSYNQKTLQIDAIEIPNGKSFAQREKEK